MFLQIRPIFGSIGAFLAGVLLLSVSACSPAGWFGSEDGDSAVLGLRPNRRVNVQCSAVDLSHEELDVRTFRKLISCLNSNGTLDPLEKLTLRATDHQLVPLMVLVNEEVLQKKARLFQISRTYKDWISQAVLDSSFAQLGHVLENEEFATSFMTLLRGAYRSLPDRTELLSAAAKLSGEISPDRVRRLLDATISVAESRAVENMRAGILRDIPASRPLRELTDALLLYAQERRPPELKGLAAAGVDAVASGKIFRVLDTAMGTEDAALQLSIPAVSTATEAMLADSGALLEPLTSLFGALRKPISCLDGGRSVLDPIGFVLGEMRLRYRDDPVTFLWRQNPLALVAMNSFCEYPSELAEYYGSMKQVSLIPGFRQLSYLLGAIQENGLTPLLAGVLGDVGPDGRTGVKRLIPLMVEAVRHGLVGDGLLTLALLRPEDRSTVQAVARFLIEPVREGSSADIVGILSQGVAGVDGEQLYRFARSLERFAGDHDTALAPALRGLRRAMFVNDAHPMIDLLGAVLARAPRDEDLYSTLFALSEMPEFADSVRLVSAMAQDGRLRELIGAVIELFSRQVEEGRVQSAVISPASEPRFVRLVRHNWSASDFFFSQGRPRFG